MIPLLTAAILVGAILSAAEGTLILLRGGVLWSAPWSILFSGLIYSAAALAGLVPLWLLATRSPAVSRRLSSPRTRFRTAVLMAGSIGMLLFAALAVRLMAYSHEELNLIALLLAFGLPVILLALRLSARRHGTSFWPLGLAAGLHLGVLLLFGALHIHYTGVVRHRAEGFESVPGSGMAPAQRPLRADREIPPHIALIVLDTVRGDHFSCEGYPAATTPHIDRIAAEGLRCAQAFSAGNWTPPGHISIFTGTYPSQHGNEGHPWMPDDLTSLTELIAPAGFYTVAIHSNHLAGPFINLTQGFDCIVGIMGERWAVPAWRTIWDRLLRQDDGTLLTARITRRLFRWMRARGGHLFLYMNLLEPHAPYMFREPYFSRFTAELDLAAVHDRADIHRLCANRHHFVYRPRRFRDFTAESFAYLRAAYDSELAYVDEHLGALFARLRREQTLDDILLVITSDHGEFLGEQSTRGHPRLLFEPVLRIPLILRYPPAIAPQVRTAPASNVDILPTIAGLTGLAGELPREVAGSDLLASEPATDRLLFSERIRVDGHCRSVRQGQHKLILTGSRLLLERFPYDTLLFDLGRDSAELHDLHRERPDLCAALCDSLQRWVSRHEVPPFGSEEMCEARRERLRALGYIY